jgi:hypothetical protein
MMLTIKTLYGPRAIRARKIVIEGVPCAVHNSVGLLGPTENRWAVTDIKSGRYIADGRRSEAAAVKYARAILRTNTPAEIEAARRSARSR